MQRKRCFKCARVLVVDEFYPHPCMRDGRLNKCKECTRADVQFHYKLTRDERAAYERERNKQETRKASKRVYQQRRAVRDPVKYKAHYTVSNALRDGRLQRGPCEVCGTTARVQAHHDDYAKPLDVRWLCFRCHREHAHGQTTAA